jgi:hypothetical protein
MARLIDDIRANGIEMPARVVLPENEQRWADHGRMVLRGLNTWQLPVIVADNVAAYYFQGTLQEQWNIVKDFPNLAPPFECFWIEHKMPHRITSETGDTDLSQFNIRVGFLIIGAEREMVEGEDLPDNMHWLLCIELFIDYGQRGHRPHGPHGIIRLAIDSEGKLIDTPSMQHYGGADAFTTEVLEKFIGWIHPALLTISFLHCKNVTVEENVVPRPLAKKYEARTGTKPCSYKTLVIEPLKQILRQQGRSDSVGLAKAMHICRGHFADYRQGKGLFGKYHQLVWFPAVVRGTQKSAGEELPERTIEVKV